MRTVETARRLRRDTTDAERRLWSRLRNGQLTGHKFRRQMPIGYFVADFACVKAKVVIELDGGQHGEQIERDAVRTEFLEKAGFIVLRFWNHEVLQNIEGVMERIQALLSARQDAAPPAPIV